MATHAGDALAVGAHLQLDDVPVRIPLAGSLVADVELAGLVIVGEPAPFAGVVQHAGRQRDLGRGAAVDVHPPQRVLRGVGAAGVELVGGEIDDAVFGIDGERPDQPVAQVGRELDLARQQRRAARPGCRGRRGRCRSSALNGAVL